MAESNGKICSHPHCTHRGTHSALEDLCLDIKYNNNMKSQQQNKIKKGICSLIICCN